MEKIKLICMAIILFALVVVSSNSVWARGGHGHGHSHIGINIGGGYWDYYGSGFYGPGYYGGYGFGNPFFYPPAYYPPVVVAPVTPPVYIEQTPAEPDESQTNYWHYCRNPEGYYPYIKECPDGWLQVVPQPGQ